MLQNKAALFICFLLSIPFIHFGQKQDVQNTLARSFALDSILQLKTYEDLEALFLNKNPQKITIVNFWATWCKPCVRELGLFELYSQKNRQSTEVYLISLDKVDDILKLADFLGKREISTHVGILLDKNYNEWIGKVDNDWSGAIPATLIFANGKKYFFEQEFENYQELQEAIEKAKNNSK